MTKKELIKATPKEVRKFGLMFSGICLLLTVFMIYKDSTYWVWAVGGSGFFLLTGLVGYPVLRPIYIGWMKFAFALGWVNTRVLLGIFFYLIITPTGLIMRMLGKDLLDEKFEPQATTYWKKRSGQFDPRTMERQF